MDPTVPRNGGLPLAWKRAQPWVPFLALKVSARHSWGTVPRMVSDLENRAKKRTHQHGRRWARNHAWHIRKNHEALRPKLRMLLACTLDVQRHVVCSHDGHHAGRIGSSGAQQDLQEGTCACDLCMGRRLLLTFGPQ